MNKRQMRRARDRRLIEHAKTSLKLRGCNCDVEIRLSTTDAPLLFQGDCLHDDWCQLVRASEAESN